MRRSTAALFILSMGIGSIALAAGTADPAAAARPKPRETRYRLHEQSLTVREGVKTGSLTKSQVRSVNAVLRKVRSLMNADIRENGTNSLTPEQETQLNGMLDGTSKTLYGEVR